MFKDLTLSLKFNVVGYNSQKFLALKRVNFELQFLRTIEPTDLI